MAKPSGSGLMIDGYSIAGGARHVTVGIIWISKEPREKVVISVGFKGSWTGAECLRTLYWSLCAPEVSLAREWPTYARFRVQDRISLLAISQPFRPISTHDPKRRTVETTRRSAHLGLADVTGRGIALNPRDHGPNKVFAVPD